ncbi:MAG: LamG domain-containing protein, partial [Candidatus Poribacteria bacterium]
ATKEWSFVSKLSCLLCHNDLVECLDNDTLDVGTGNFSVVAWIKCAKYDPGEWEAQIVYKFDHTAPRHGYLLAVRGSLDAANKNKPVFILGLGDASGIHMFGTSPINDGNWHHLTVTVDRSSSMILYRDGDVESQVNIAGYAKQNEDNSKVFNIGSETGTPGRYIKSVIDDVALFKTVLTPPDIKDLMDYGLERVLGGKAVNASGKLANTWAKIKIY